MVVEGKANKALVAFLALLVEWVLVRKGRLRYLVRTTPAGQAFTIMDGQNRTLEGASVSIAAGKSSPLSSMWSLMASPPRPQPKQ